MTTDVLDLMYTKDIVLHITDTLVSKEVYDEILSYPKDNTVFTENKGLEVIAYYLYGDVDLWQVLAVYNGITDPMVVPEEVYVIPKDDLFEILSKG